MSFLGDSSRIVTGGFFGEIKVFDSNSNMVLDCCTSHQLPVTLLQSSFVGVNQLVLSSTAKDVCLWDASSISGGPNHSFKGIKAAIFSNSGSVIRVLYQIQPTEKFICIMFKPASWIVCFQIHLAASCLVVAMNILPFILARQTIGCYGKEFSGIVGVQTQFIGLIGHYKLQGLGSSKPKTPLQCPILESDSYSVQCHW